VARRTSATTSSAVRGRSANADEAISARSSITRSGRAPMDALVPLRALVGIDASGDAPLRLERHDERHLRRLTTAERQGLGRLLGLALQPRVPDARVPGPGREPFQVRLAVRRR